MTPVRSPLGLAARLARQWWPHVAALAAACGIVAATIAGAMGVGGSLSRSLRELALARLGGIEAAVSGDRLFRARLAEETAARLRSARPRAGLPGARGEPAVEAEPRVVPAVVMEVSLESPAGPRGRVSRATLLACDDPARLGFAAATPAPPADAVSINPPLAAALGVRPGDPLVIRIPRLADVPSDNPLGRRTAESWSRRLRLADILPAAGLGGFSLRPTQVTGGLVVMSLEAFRSILRLAEPPANTLFLVGADRSADAAGMLRAAVRPTLEDLGLVVEPPLAGRGPRLSSRRFLLPPETDRTAREVFGPLGGRPTLALLATELRSVARGGNGPAAVPYSTVVGIDATSLPVGELVDESGTLLAVPGPDEIVIDRWLADDFAAQGVPVAVGDAIALRTFLPETLHGRVEETTCTLRVSGVAAMRSAAVARDLVPEVEGITDEKSIADWDPPFPFDRGRVRTTPPHDEDDRYWKDHGTTPKAFVSLDTARRLAASRFGGTTAWHLPALPAAAAAAARTAFAAAVDSEPLGMRVLPLRARAEAAARGSTPFGTLFLALSSFTVAAGLLLESLLFSLLVAARRRDVGILAAVGWPEARVRTLLVAVGGVAAAAGILVGTVVGPLWSQVLLGWLARAWNADVSPGATAVFAARPPGWTAIATALPAAAAAAAASLAGIVVAARRAARLPPLALLKGAAGVDGAAKTGAGGGRAGRWLAALGPVAAVALAWSGRHADAQAALGCFFGAGIAALAGVLAVVSLLLGRAAGAGGRPVAGLAGLAWRGLRHGRSRGFSVAAIVACAEFLIVAVSAFSLHPPSRPDDRGSPTGGWTCIASFGTPTGIDPSDPQARESLGLSTQDVEVLSRCTIERIRSSGGDDASCTNLYATTEPTVLGVGPTFVARGGFRFVDHARLPDPAGREPPAGATNPWALLHRDGGQAIPVILDQATAQWALKLGGVGARFTVPADEGRVELEIVGLLEPGILQGSLIVSERNFARMFPRRSGYSLALVDAGDTASAGASAAGDPLAAAISAAWADAGVTVTRARDRLRSLQAVQNTFLAGFQALGTLGLLLGAAGVAAVQVQSVLERAGGFGLLAAVGFSAGRLRWLVVLETACMLLVGLAAGTLAGALAVVPAFTGGHASLPVGWIAVTWLLMLAAAVVAGIAASWSVTRLAPARVLAAGD